MMLCNKGLAYQLLISYNRSKAFANSMYNFLADDKVGDSKSPPMINLTKYTNFFYF